MERYRKYKADMDLKKGTFHKTHVPLSPKKYKMYGTDKDL